MVRWLRWHCPPDTGFEMRALTIWGRARYLPVKEAPQILNLYEWAEKKHFVSLKRKRQSGGRAQQTQIICIRFVNPRSPIFQASSFKHCTRPPAIYPLHVKPYKYKVHVMWFNGAIMGVGLCQLCRVWVCFYVLWRQHLTAGGDAHDNLQCLWDSIYQVLSKESHQVGNLRLIEC